MKAAALRGALSDRARNGRIHVVEGLVSGDKPSTKAALAALAGLTDRTRYLVVLERGDAVTWLSLRNAPEVHIVAVDQLNTYDVLAADDVIFTQGAYDTFVNGTASTTERKASHPGSRRRRRGASRPEARARRSPSCPPARRLR